MHRCWLCRRYASVSRHMSSKYVRKYCPLSHVDVMHQSSLVPHPGIACLMYQDFANKRYVYCQWLLRSRLVVQLPKENNGRRGWREFHRIFSRVQHPPFYAGPTMAMIAYKCPDIQVVVVDINAARIAAWNSEVRTHPPSLRLQWQQ